MRRVIEILAFALIVMTLVAIGVGLAAANSRMLAAMDARSGLPAGYTAEFTTINGLNCLVVYADQTDLRAMDCDWRK